MHVYRRAALLAATFMWMDAAAAQTFTLGEAVRSAVSNSPDGEAAAVRLEVLDAARSAADTSPAPTINGTVENIGTPSFSQWQIDGTYNQRIERGGKRAARVDLVRSEIEVAEAQAMVRRLDLARDVQALYVEAQSALLSLELARSRVEIAQALAQEVQRRVDEARDPLFAGTRVRTRLAEAQVDLGLAEHAYEAALARFALLIGSDPETTKVDTAGFLEPGKIGQGPVDLNRVDLSIYDARRSRADANYRLQEANARTDPTLFAGPRLYGTGDVGVVAGFSIPLPNRALNRAQIDRAAAQQRQIEADLAVERFHLQQEIALAAERVEEARHEAEAIQQQVVPGAEQTLREVREGYNRGSFSFLDVSTAQSDLHNARTRFVAALTEYHVAKVDYDRLTGRLFEFVRGN